MRKWSFRILAVLLILGLAIPAVMWAINSNDPPLEPEVVQALESHVQFSDRQMRAYYFVLGVYSGEIQDPEQKGAQLWARRGSPGFWRDLATPRPWQNDFMGCGNDPCTVEFLVAHPEIAKKLEVYKIPMELYSRLMQYGEGATLFQGDRENVMPVVSGLPYYAHRVFLLLLAEYLKDGKTKKALDLLQASNGYLSGFFNIGNLFERTVALAELNANARFLAAELKRSPRLKLSHALVDSFAVPDVKVMLQGAMETELRIFDNVVHGIPTIRDLELSSLGPKQKESPLDHFKDLISMRLILRPNEALNKYFAISRELQDSSCPQGASVTACASSAGWLEFHGPMEYLVNPAGRVLVKIMLKNVAESRSKLQQRAGQIQAMKLEFETHAQK